MTISVVVGLVLETEPAQASAAAGEVILVSHSPVGPATTPNGLSQNSSTSADGAFVAFTSSAENLVAGQSDANASSDVFLFERATGAVTLVSHLPASSTTTANGFSEPASISADGAFVAFTSAATNLVAGQSDANGTRDAFLFERATGAVTLASHTPASFTTTANNSSDFASISADGAFVGFTSFATNLVAGQSDANATLDAFLFERATGAVTLVSHLPASSTTTANRGGYSPFISANGAFVAFTSDATNLVAGQSDANPYLDVFLFERATGAVTLVSHRAASSTTTASHRSERPSISADGAFVTFMSSSLDLVAGQSNRNSTFNVFLFERATGVVTLVSHLPASSTTTANHLSYFPLISADGAFVAFESRATDLVVGQSDADPSGTLDVFLFERATGVVTLVSHLPASSTTTANGSSDSPSISADGAFVAFTSSATDLAAGQSDANGSQDVFLFARPAAATAGTFTALPPARILDTRFATGTCTPSPCAPVAAGTPVEVQVTGQGGVPASGVTAVVMSVAVTAPANDGFLRVWPSHSAEPNASNLNYVAGQTVPNLVTVKLSATGTVKISHNAVGPTHVIADVAGWYGDGTGPPGSRFNPLTPARILDTRFATGTCTPSPCAPVAAGTPVEVQVAGQGGVPADGVSAVVMSVAVTGPTNDGFLRVWPSDSAEPEASNLNYVAGETVPNLVVVKLSATGTVKVSHDAVGSTHVVADVAGWYGAAGAATGARFTPVTPARILDSRFSAGTCTPSPCAPVAGGTPVEVQVTGQGGVPANGVSAVVMSVAVTGPTNDGFLRVWPSDAAEPNASNLNYVAGQTVPNLVAVKLSATGTVKISHNAVGSTHVVADVAGWFNAE